MTEISKALVLMIITTMLVLCKSQNDVRKIISTAVNRFSDSLYLELAKERGNIAFSPFALHSALALLSLGAAEYTQEEILLQLFLPNTHILKNGYQTILNEYHNKVEQNPIISNALFISKDLSLHKTFEAYANNFFYTDLKKVNFGRPKQVAAIINEWISRRTNHSLSTGVSENFLNYQTAMLILNTIYFNGEWNLKFDKSYTQHDFNFYSPKGTVKCNMMVMGMKKHNITYTDKFSYLELSFRTTNIKIAFIRPKNGYPLSYIEKNLNARTLFSIRNNLKPQQMVLKVPKFKLNKEYSFKSYLMSIGLWNIFINPNLSNMFENPIPTNVDAIDQNTIVEIDEDGAVAASVTKVAVVSRAVIFFPEYVLDEPFLFYIYDSKDNMILIRGRVENPMGDTL